MNNSRKIKRLVGMAILAVIMIALQVLANYITIGTVSITLALIPIVIGAILYGPGCGAILGFINGLIVLTAPSTIGVFMPLNPLATIFICLFKTTMAGFLAGLIFKVLFKKNLKLSVILASISVPIINTVLFSIGCFLFYQELLVQDGMNAFEVLIITMIGFNFIIEFLVNSLGSPMVLYLIKIATQNYNIGSNLDENIFK